VRRPVQTTQTEVETEENKPSPKSPFPAKGELLGQNGSVSWLELQTYSPRLPTRRFWILDFRFWIEPKLKNLNSRIGSSSGQFCGFRSSYSCGAAGDFSHPSPVTPAILDFGLAIFDFAQDRFWI
jgi:hypothetical protein